MANEIETIEAVNCVTGQVKGQLNKILINLEINHKVISFQMDSGATASTINANTYALLRGAQQRIE